MIGDRNTNWFKAGARIGRTGGEDWHARRVIHWVLAHGGTATDAKEAATGFLAERKLAALGDRTGTRLGK